MHDTGLTLDDFLGEWSIERQIDDRRAGAPASFSGTARFDPAESGLLYCETGQLFLPNAPPLAASRRYLWRQAEGRIHVLFEDGRAFHDFSPNFTVSAAGHSCDPDRYDVSYDFSDWPAWHCRWRVNGPRKDYVMDSRYLRA